MRVGGCRTGAVVKPIARQIAPVWGAGTIYGWPAGATPGRGDRRIGARPAQAQALGRAEQGTAGQNAADSRNRPEEADPGSRPSINSRSLWRLPRREGRCGDVRTSSALGCGTNNDFAHIDICGLLDRKSDCSSDGIRRHGEALHRGNDLGLHFRICHGLREVRASEAG